jgi:peroxiredoxin
MFIATLKKMLPFVIIFIAVIALIQTQKQTGPMAGPEITLLDAAVRSAQGTEFTLPDLRGEPTRLADFKGNVVLLNFWATWCGPCREEIPTLQKLFNDYHRKNFVIVGVAGDVQGQEVVASFAKKQQLTFPVVLDQRNEVSQQYRVRSIPTVYLLDRQGRIAGMYVGGADWNSPAARATIDKLLQES